MAAAAPAAPAASRRRPRLRPPLHGGGPGCARRFTAAAPAGLEPGAPFGPNLRAFVLYLRFAQAIPFARLARLMHDLFGLAISEGALANLLQDSAPAFKSQTSRIKQRLLSGTVLACERAGSSSACSPAPCWPPTRPV